MMWIVIILLVLIAAYLFLIAAALMFAYLLRFVFHHKTDDALFAISMMTLRSQVRNPVCLNPPSWSVRTVFWF